MDKIINEVINNLDIDSASKKLIDSLDINSDIRDCLIPPKLSINKDIDVATKFKEYMTSFRKKKYTPMGLRDSIYIYILKHGIDKFFNKIKKLPEKELQYSKNFYKFIYFICPNVIHYIEISNLNKEVHKWMMYNNTWKEVSFPILKNILQKVIREYNFNLTIDEALNGILESRILFINDPLSLFDRKDITVMPNFTYDHNYLYVRKKLPSDTRDRVINYDPSTLDGNAYQALNDEMEKSTLKWLSRLDVYNMYMRIISMSLEDFEPRFAVINKGTGSDGKSTFLLIIKEIFGTLCTSTRASIWTTKINPNSPSPGVMKLKGAGIIISNDDCPVDLTQGETFKLATGNDPIDGRGLYVPKSSDFTIKSLIILNYNMESLNIENIAGLSRVLVVNFGNKILDEATEQLLPETTIKKKYSGDKNYHKTYVTTYGNIFVSEIIKHHRKYKSGDKLIIPECVKESTRDVCTPKIISNFITDCMIRYKDSNSSITDKEHAKKYKEANTKIISKNFIKNPNMDKIYETFVIYNELQRTPNSLYVKDKSIFSRTMLLFKNFKLDIVHVNNNEKYVYFIEGYAMMRVDDVSELLHEEEESEEEEECDDNDKDDGLGAYNSDSD